MDMRERFIDRIMTCALLPDNDETGHVFGNLSGNFCLIVKPFPIFVVLRSDRVAP